MDLLDQRLAALADPVRRAILARLAESDASVGELGAPFAISQPAISRHLKILESAGLIEPIPSGRSRPRRLRREALTETAQALNQMANLWSDSFDRLDAFLISPAPTKETPHD